MMKEIHITFMKGLFFVFVVSVITFGILTLLAPVFNEILVTEFSITYPDNDIITGMVPSTLDQVSESITPSFSGSDFESITHEYDSLIMDACRGTHYRAGDCFYLIKSIMSVTSRGDANFIDEQFAVYGLIPLNYQSIPETQREEMNVEDLLIPEVNIIAASRYLMRLYDVYNGDLAFTALAYYAGRGITNEIMYSFQRSVQSASDRNTQITTSRIFSELDDIYMMSSTLRTIPNLRQKNDIKQFYVNVLSAYHFWAESPMQESSTANLLFDTGTYSIRPSFSASINYDIREIHYLRNILNEFISSSSEKNFEGLKDFLIENNDGEILENGNVKTDQFVWLKGACNSEERVFEAFIQRLIECMSSKEVDCHCDFNDIYFDNGEFSIHVSFESIREVPSIEKINLIFELIETSSEEMIKKYTHPISLTGYYDKSFEFHIAQTDFGVFQSFIDWLFGESDEITKFKLQRDGKENDWEIDPDTLRVAGSQIHPRIFNIERDGIKKLTFVRKQTNFEFKGVCETNKQYQKICVKNNRTKIYNKNENAYTPIQYSFALAVNPTELENEEYNREVEDIDSFTAALNGKTIAINPASGCSEPNCFENIIFGKPISYSNKRENIMIVSLDEKTISSARNKFISLLSSERTYEDWIDEKHRAVHYIVDENGIIAKLAREDAIVQFSRCFDGNSIYIGLVGDSNKYSNIQINALAKLSYEISLRNDINPSRINFYNNYRENELLRRPNSFPEDYSCELNPMYDIHESSARAHFNFVLSEIIRAYNEMQETQEPEIHTPAGLLE